MKLLQQNSPFMWVFVLACIVAELRKCEAQLPFAPGGRNGLMGAFTGESDFFVRVHAPQEDTQDILDSLDSLLKIEEAERRADEEDYVAEKQRLLNVQKSRIRDIVHGAFEPLHAMLPNPIDTAVVKHVKAYWKKKKSYNPFSFREMDTDSTSILPQDLFSNNKLPSQEENNEIVDDITETSSAASPPTEKKNVLPSGPINFVTGESPEVPESVSTATLVRFLL